MIFLLSDNKETALTIQNDLAKEGFNVDTMDNFSKAMLHLNNHPDYEMILLDFDYDGHDVLEVCEKIKRNITLKWIPLICIIDKNKVRDQLLLFELGVDDFIFMPYSAPEIQLKLRSIQRMIDLQNQLQLKDAQLDNLKNIQRIMVTLNHYINNALTPLYFAVQIMDEQEEDGERVKEIAKDTVEFISKVLQSLHQIVQSGKIRILKEGVYKDIMFDIEQELNKLLEKTKQTE